MSDTTNSFDEAIANDEFLNSLNGGQSSDDDSTDKTSADSSQAPNSSAEDSKECGDYPDEEDDEEDELESMDEDGVNDERDDLDDDAAMDGEDDYNDSDEDELSSDGEGRASPRHGRGDGNRPSKGKRHDRGNPSAPRKTRGKVEKLAQRLRENRLESEEPSAEADHPHRGGDRPDERDKQSARSGRRSGGAAVRVGNHDRTGGRDARKVTRTASRNVQSDQPSLQLQDTDTPMVMVNPGAGSTSDSRDQKIQRESELKDAVTAPRTQLKPDQKLSDQGELLTLIRWFITVKPYVVRKRWSSQVEQWVFKQILSGSRAEYFINQLIESDTFVQLGSGCYFDSFTAFKQGMVSEAFKDQALNTIVEDTLLSIKVDHKAADSATWACEMK